jgi:hypothetical protein
VARARLELADVVRAHRDDFARYRGGRIPSAERRVLDDVAACRTEARGGHVEECATCGHRRIAYNSCRNRHCPKCQEAARATWLAAREREVLPVEYFHVVFTVPHELGDLALQNKAVLYDLLFRASSETLLTLAADPKHLGAAIGCLAVLHTWGQTLEHHPHVHCLVPGGGLSRDGAGWVSCRQGFLLPVRVLARLFRGRFLHLLREAFDRDALGFHGRLAHLVHPDAFRSFLTALYEKDWVVYAKPPFGGPALVLRYLARYTSRVALSNRRLVAMQEDRVTFLWKDYRHDSKTRKMTLGAVPFLQRFLLHILPKSFQRIRYYGLLANRGRATQLDRCRTLLAAAPVPPTEDLTPAAAAAGLVTCPACQRGRMICVLVVKSWEVVADVSWASQLDSS